MESKETNSLDKGEKPALSFLAQLVAWMIFAVLLIMAWGLIGLVWNWARGVWGL